MANRRMFSKVITNSSRFLMMSLSAQALYFHLGMNADDDGFCEHFAIMRMVEAKPDDLKVLQAKGFVKVFDDRVLIIRDWKENNYLRSDRYTPSRYLEEYKEELALLSDKSGIPVVDQMATQVRLGKDRKGKETTAKGRGGNEVVYNPLGAEIIKTFESIDPKNKTYYGNTNQRKACDFLLDEYGLEEVKKRISFLPRSNRIPYFPTITTPVQLRDKWVQLQDAVERYRTEKGGKNKVAFV